VIKIGTGGGGLIEGEVGLRAHEPGVGIFRIVVDHRGEIAVGVGPALLAGGEDAALFGGRGRVSRECDGGARWASAAANSPRPIAWKAWSS
jgi:hypothetical protein